MAIKPFQLERYFARYEFTTRHLLCSSDCESVSVADLLALEPGSEERLRSLWLGYTESSGSPDLRRAISRIYENISPDQVLVHSGAEEAIFTFMHATLSAGDHVIVHRPCYQSLYEVAASIGCEVTNWNAREENGWALDLDELKAALRPNTRAVILNTPHNPTGFLMSLADFAELNRLAQEKGFWLFCDEVYRESEYDPSLRLPAAVDVNPLAVSLGVVSKTYGLAGLRIGWVAAQQAEVLQRMAVIKDYTTICSSAPSELLATIALDHRETLAARNLGIIKANLALLDTFFSAHTERFSWVRPRAGSIAFPRYLGGDIDAFCHELVTRAGVLLLPGTLFGDKGDHFRIGFGRRSLPEALAALENFIDQNAG
jgi:aspartate/methionine/tyrosine aminotransferase